MGLCSVLSRNLTRFILFFFLWLLAENRPCRDKRRDWYQFWNFSINLEERGWWSGQVVTVKKVRSSWNMGIFMKIEPRDSIFPEGLDIDWCNKTKGSRRVLRFLAWETKRKELPSPQRGQLWIDRVWERTSGIQVWHVECKLSLRHSDGRWSRWEWGSFWI